MPSNAYVPLDLTAYRNAPAAVLAHDQSQPALGYQDFQGIPFSVGSQDAAFIGLDVQLTVAGSVSVTDRARAVLPIHTLQLVPVSAHGWLCARVGGPNYEPIAHHDVWRRGVFAHTSPIYVAVGDARSMNSPDGLQYLLTLVEGGLAYARTLAPRRPDHLVTHHHGEPVHQAFLERPFLEAQAALRARLQ